MHDGKLLMRWKLPLGLALLVFVGSIYVSTGNAVFTGGGLISATAGGALAKRTSDFINSMGSGVSGTTSAVVNAYSYMGITSGRSAEFNTSANTTAAAGGLKLDLLFSGMTCSSTAASQLTSKFATYDTLVQTYPGSILSIEGPNETNNQPVCWLGAQTTNSATAAGFSVLSFSAGSPVPPGVLNAVNAGYAAGFTLLDASSTVDPGFAYNSYSSNTSVNVTFTIYNANETLVAFIASNGGAIASFTDTLGLVWTRRATTGGAAPIEEWTASGPSGGSFPRSDTVVFTPTTSPAYISASVTGIFGASGFDGSPVTGSSDPLTISTSHANTIVLGSFRMSSQSAPTAGSGYTQLNNGFFQLTEYQTFTTPQTNKSVTIGTGVGNANGGIADALVLSGLPVSAAITPGTSITSATSTTVVMTASAVGNGVANGDQIIFQAKGVEPSTNPSVSASSIAWQTDIYNKTHADTNMVGVNVLNYTGFVPSIPSTNPNNPPSLAGTADWNNFHFYPGAGSQPTPWTGASSMAAALASGTAAGILSSAAIPGIGTQVTETGWCTPSSQSDAVDQTTQAILIMNDYFDMFQAGVPHTYEYTIFDVNTGDTTCFDNYGFFSSNQTTPKTSAVAMNSLTGILADAGGAAKTFTPTRLNYSITGMNLGPSGGNSMLLQKSNGNFYIVIWNEPSIWNNSTHLPITPSTSSITVNFGATFTKVNVYDPMLGTAVQSSCSSCSSIALSLAKDPLIVEITPGSAAVAAWDGTTWNNPPASNLTPTYGTVTHGAYYSNLMRTLVGFNIYLPPGYSQSAITRYPVIYVTPDQNNTENWANGSAGLPKTIGICCDAGTTYPASNSNQLLDNAIHLGTVVPTIVVYANIGLNSKGMDAQAGSSAYPNYLPESSFITELIPYIDSHYLTIATGAGRGMHGFSMGGGACLRFAMKYTRMFTAAYCSSPAIDDVQSGFAGCPSGCNAVTTSQPQLLACMYNGNCGASTGGNAAAFQQNNAWGLARVDSSTFNIPLTFNSGGTTDNSFGTVLSSYDSWLSGSSVVPHITHTYTVHQGCPHDYQCISSGLNWEQWLFFSNRFGGGQGGPFTISAPSAVSPSSGVTTGVSGVSITFGSMPAGDIFTVTVADSSGLLSASGSSTSTSLTIVDTLANINAALASLTFNGTGNDTISINASDNNGNNATQKFITVTPI